MAEGLLRTLGDGHFEVASVGTESLESHPLAADVMREDGINISDQKAMTVAESLKHHFAYVITFYDASRERSPIFPFAPHLFRWSLPDPGTAPGPLAEQRQAFRRTRDEIRKRVERFMDDVQHTHQLDTRVAA
jgi:arsenate reductase